MSFVFFDIVAQFFQVFGSAYLIATVIIFMVLSILLAFNGGKELILMILMPLVFSMAVGTSAYFAVPTYFVVVLFFLMGSLFAGIYFMILR